MNRQIASLVASMCLCWTAAAQVQGEDILNGRVNGVEASARVVSQRYCAQEVGDEVFVIRADLQITLTNRSPRRIIVSRQLASHGPFRVEVAKSIDAARQQRLESITSNDLEVYPPDVKVPEFGSSPLESEFIVLEPGQSCETMSSLGLLARARGVASAPHALEVGSKHVIRVTVSLWPHRMMAEADVAGLRKRWASVGKLVAGMITTDFFPLELDADRVPVACATSKGGR